MFLYLSVPNISETPTFSEALKAGKVVTLKSINTLVSCLASPYISAQSLANYNKHRTHVQMIDDLEAVKGSIDFYDHFGTLVERHVVLPFQWPLITLCI